VRRKAWLIYGVFGAYKKRRSQARGISRVFRGIKKSTVRPLKGKHISQSTAEPYSRLALFVLLGALVDAASEDEATRGEAEAWLVEHEFAALIMDTLNLRPYVEHYLEQDVATRRSLAVRVRRRRGVGGLSLLG